MRSATFPMLVMLSVAWPGSVYGQERECDFVADVLNRREIATGQIMLEMQGNVLFTCSDGVRLRADQATQWEWLGQFTLTGNVEYRDAEQTLTADYLVQDAQQGTLYASGNVVLRDRANGSVIRGAQLNHTRETDFFPARTYVTGSPSAVLGNGGSAGRGGGARGGSQEPPTQVFADQMEIDGSGVFRANNNVRIQRGEARGSSQAAEFHQDDERMRLVGDARFEDESYLITGNLIDAHMADGQLEDLTAVGLQAMLAAHEPQYDVWGDTIRMRVSDGRPLELIANTNVALKGDEIDIRAPRRLNLTFDDGKLSRMVAVATLPEERTDATPAPALGLAQAPTTAPRSMPPPATGPLLPTDSAAGRARVQAQGFLVLADSVDLLAPGEQLTELRAVGDVFARALPTPDSSAAAAGHAATPDTGSTAAASPAEAPESELPEVLAQNWVRGDTVIAYFTTDSVTGQAPVTADSTTAAATPDDSTGDAHADAKARPRPVLDRLLAVGGATPASTLYRMARQDGSAGETIHYVVAGKIIIQMRDGEVTAVDAIDLLYGRIFEPDTGAPPLRRP